MLTQSFYAADLEMSVDLGVSAYNRTTVCDVMRVCAVSVV